MFNYRLLRFRTRDVSRVKRGISTCQALSAELALSAEILPRFARQDTSLARKRQRLISPRRVLSQGLFIGLIIALSACSKKDSGSSDSDEALPISVPVTGAQPTTGVSSVAAPGSAKLEGLPGNPSNSKKLNVIVSGTELIGYICALVDGKTSCNDIKYSESRQTSDVIADAIGSDGQKLLCVAAESIDSSGVHKISLLSHSWYKDTVSPSVSVNHAATIGPFSTSGNKTRFTVVADDNGSGLGKVYLSISKNASESSCLNSAKTAFSAACPSYIETSLLTATSYSIDLADSLFSSTANYSLKAMAADLAGNTSVSTAVASAWDVTPPPQVATLTATAGKEEATISWTAAAGAAKYLVIRRATDAVEYIPDSNESFTLGQHLGSEHFVAYVGAKTSFVDENLTAFVVYNYKVYPIDAASNLQSISPTAVVQPDMRPAFQGLTYAYLRGPARRIETEWQKFTKSGSTATQMSYGLFSSEVPSSQDFSAVPVAEKTNAEGVGFVDTDSSENLYLAVRSWGSDQIQDTNARELRLKFTAGTHHKIASNGRFLGEDPLDQAYLRSPWALDTDPYGNVIFGGASGIINALCREVSSAYYCKGREIGKVYTIAGSDGMDDSSDGVLASAAALGDIYGIDFDSGGNMYLADATFYRVRAVCFNPLASGFCNSKKIGYIYHVTGTGSSSDGLDDSVAKTTAIGAPYSVAVDSKGNIFFADYTFRRLRAACFSQSGFCLGKVLGNIYTVAGTGALTDGGDNLPRLSSSFGAPKAMSMDVKGNLFFTDFNYRRVRAVCLSVDAGSGYCTGKTAGNVYRIMGDGTLADGASNSDALTTSMGTGNGISVSGAGNVYVTDSYYRLRVLCNEAAVDYFCLGKTVGNVYRLAGTGASTDGISNSVAINTAIGDPRGITIDASGNLILADFLRKRIRLLCTSNDAASVCAGRFAGYHYYLVGSGSATMGWQSNAMRTPIGTPQGIAIDSHGNIFYGDAASFLVRVTCYDTTSAGVCFGKVAGNSYFVVGTGVTGNSADDVEAQASPIGVPTGLDVDSEDNLYIADYSYRFIRVVCLNVSGTGYCAGKTAGNMYRFAGSGSNGDSADNVLATSAATGLISDVALDAFDNVYLLDAGSFRVRLVCRSTQSACAGKTIGNMYRFAGTGATSNGADNGVATSTGFGIGSALEVDPWNNVALGDSYFRVRYVCNNTSGGFCSGRTAGRVYHAAGTGVTGDGADDSVATATANGVSYGLAIDAAGNVYIADMTYRRIRVLCVDTTSGYCTGLTSGNIYRMIGTGVLGDSSSSMAGNLVTLDTPARDSIALTSSRDIIFVGSSGSMRMFLGY